MACSWLAHRACLLPDLEGVRSKAKSVVHRDAPIHLFVAWAVGAALAFLAESYRRYSSASLVPTLTPDGEVYPTCGRTTLL